MSGRPRKPTAVLELNGAFKKDPKRAAARANEPEPNGEIGKPPAYFDDEHRAIWNELVDETAPGVLAKSDRTLVELTVRLKRKMRVMPGRASKWQAALAKVLKGAGVDKDTVTDMLGDIRAAIGMSSQDASLLASCLTRMGLTPADRSRVQAIKKPAEAAQDPFDAAFAQIKPRSIARPN